MENKNTLTTKNTLIIVLGIVAFGIFVGRMLPQKAKAPEEALPTISTGSAKTGEIKTGKVIAIDEVSLYAKEVELKKEKQAVLDSLGYYDTALYMKGLYTGKEVETLKKIDADIIDARNQRAKIIDDSIKYDKVVFR